MPTWRLDRVGLVAHVDGLIARFTPDYFARHSALGTDDETPLMVLGMPRSGTTLTEQIISSHPAVAGGGELPFRLEAGPPLARLAARGLSSENAQTVAAEYMTVLRNIAPDAVRVTEGLQIGSGEQVGTNKNPPL